MRARRPEVVAAVTVVALILAAWLTWRPGPGSAPSVPATQTGEVIAPSVPATPGASSSPAASAARGAATGVVSGERAAVEVGETRRMIGDYHTLMGENPVGTNAEIMQTLMGHNPRQATLGPPEGQTLNEKGELVDPWGTPYFFHQLSRDRMEVHSAGPDRIMGTPDDLVVK